MQPMSDSNEKIDGMDKWEVEDAARTLRKAAELQGNDKLLTAAKKQLDREAEDIEKAKKMLSVEEKA